MQNYLPMKITLSLPQTQRELLSKVIDLQLNSLMNLYEEARITNPAYTNKLAEYEIGNDDFLEVLNNHYLLYSEMRDKPETIFTYPTTRVDKIEFLMQELSKLPIQESEDFRALANKFKTFKHSNLNFLWNEN
jgi:hypothetical protein